MNRPQELINILRILGRFKEIFPDSLYYLYRYCAAKKTRFGLVCTGASCTMELNKIIRHYCYFRKELRDVVNELPQRPAELEQATGRIDRMGQTQTMNVYFLLSSDTIDTQIRELLDGKIKVTDAVNKGIDVQVSRDDSMDIALIKKLKEWKEKK